MLPSYAARLLRPPFLNGMKASANNSRVLHRSIVSPLTAAGRRSYSTFGANDTATHRFSGVAVALVAIGVGLSLQIGSYAQSEGKDTQKDLEKVPREGETKGSEQRKGATVEERVASVNDLKDGEMKEVQIGEVKILLSRVNGTYYATGLKCTHFGAPLHKGALAGDQVICPWHAAAFSVKTGEVIGAPALDGLPVYPVRIEGDSVYVTVPTGPAVEKAVLQRKGHRCACSEDKVYVIVGAGPAGLVAAQTIRQDGFKGRVVLITKEDDLPYDRTMLSKVVGIPKNKVLLRDEAFYKTHDIEVLRGREVSEVDPNTKKVSFSDGSSISFDRILLATGASPFMLNVPGNGLSGVHALRSLGDSSDIIGSVEGAKKAVVIGSSFIGMEVAAFLRKNKNLDVTVIGLEQVPFERVLGPNVGSAFQNLHEENGVKFKLGRTVTEITGKGAVDGVLLDDGTKVEADLVVMGVGVRPVTNYLKGVDRDKDGGLSVDSHLKLRKFDNVYVAGDIARFPYAYGDENIRIEHWNVAQDTGRIAGHNMAGQTVEYKGVPFFWTNQFGVGLRYAGYSANYDEVYVDGSIKDRKFIAYYIKGGKIQAVAVMGRDPAGPAAQALFSLGKMPTVAEVKKGSIDLTQRLTEVTA